MRVHDRSKTVAGSVNKVILLGTVGKYGCTLTYSPSGSACCKFMLLCIEETVEHKHFTTAIPCEIYGKRAEAISTDLAPGLLCLFEGKVSRKKRGEQWEFSVAGFDVTLIQIPALQEVAGV
jgi:primosomal replication protein N